MKKSVARHGSKLLLYLSLRGNSQNISLNTIMNKAVFLDRDGVINSDEGHYYVHRPQDFVFTPQLPLQLKRLADANYLLFVISNQGGIARGLYTLEDTQHLHQNLQTSLLKDNVQITEFCVCPHHPEHSNCLCRKPSPLMVQKCLARFNVDATQSYFLGDRQSDMQAAQAAGVQGIFIERNQGISNAVSQILQSIR
ncbi:MAG: D-glycero-alpha-D-manno-heptose-1,7-bisphosphate 7-phosphatase [Bacteroidales bacterium]